MLTADDVVRGLPDVDPTAVRAYWPLIAQALAERGLISQAVQVATAATVRAEVGARWRPVAEIGTPASFAKYDPGTSAGRVLGNTQAGDGYRYRGRGFVQLTGRDNYTRMGQALGVPLATEPDLALHPDVAASILAEYMSGRGIPSKAAAGDWQGVRVAVNGGLNGWDVFQRAVQSLTGALERGAAAVAGGVVTGATQVSRVVPPPVLWGALAGLLGLWWLVRHR